ncbi:MAG TPA: glycosyltransferase family 39 protein [Chloroflexota bacterium]|nr:glycosyltransferase family 39 protein [Chloroflexota bacterium]
MPANLRACLDRPLLLLSVFLLGLYLLTMAGRLTSGDGETVYQTTKAIITQGTLRVPTRPETAVGRGGYSYGKYGLGQSVVQAPFFVAGHGVEKLMGTGDDRLTRFLVGMTNSAVSVALVTVFWLLARALGATPRVATVAGLVLGLCTLVWPYARADFSEPLQASAALTTFYGLVRWRQAPAKRWAALAGIAAGAAFHTKAASLVVLLPLAGYFIVAAWRYIIRAGRMRVVLESSIVAFAPFLLCGLFQAGLNYYRFGKLTEFGYGDEPATGFTTPILVGVHYLLFSTGKGLILFAPPVLLGMAGLAMFRRRHGLEASTAALVFLAELLYFARWWAWHGDWSWGPRYLYIAVPFLLLGWLPFLSGWKRRALPLKAIAVSLAGAGLIVSFLGIAIDYGGYYSIVGSQIGRGVDVKEARLVPQFSPILGHAWLARASLYEALKGNRNYAPGAEQHAARSNPFLAEHPWAESHPHLTPEAPERALGFDFWFAALRGRTPFLEYWCSLAALWLAVSLVPLGYRLWGTIREDMNPAIDARMVPRERQRRMETVAV